VVRVTDTPSVHGDAVPATEPGDRPVVGRRVGRQPAEGHVQVTPALHLPGRGDPGRAGEQQELEHYRRVIGRSANGLGVGVVDRREFELVVDYLGDEPGRVILGQPVIG